MHVFHKEGARVETLHRKLGKNSQHWSITLHTPFDEHYKINGRQEGEVEVLQAHFEQVPAQLLTVAGKKMQTKKHLPTWECYGVSVKEMYGSVHSFYLISYGCQGYCMESNRNRNA